MRTMTFAHRFPVWLAPALALVAFACGESSPLGGTPSSAGSSGAESSDSVSGAGSAGAVGSADVAAGGGAAQPTLRQPPIEPSGPEQEETIATVLAVTKLFLGDTDRSGTESPDAWRNFGYDLDGLASAVGDENHCTLVDGADEAVLQDGIDGTDNSFGRNLLGVLRILDPQASEVLDQELENGDFTYLFRFDNLGGGLTQTGVSAALYNGAALPEPPSFDGGDVWPVAADSVNADDLDDPRVRFASSYVAEGTWVSGTQVDFPLTMIVSGIELVFDVQGAVITMELEASDSSASATNGVIAGVVEAEKLVEEFRRVAGSFDPVLCTGPIVEGLADTIRRASDIMLDGTNGDPGQTCNGISIGLGFEASAVQLGEVAPPEDPPPDPCAE